MYQKLLLLKDIVNHDVVSFVPQDNDGLIERWKRKDMENILELHNKAPVWNEGLTCLHLCLSVWLRIVVSLSVGMSARLCTSLCDLLSVSVSPYCSKSVCQYDYNL